MYLLMCLKFAGRVATDGVDPNQAPPKLFAQTYLSE